MNLNFILKKTTFACLSFFLFSAAKTQEIEHTTCSNCWNTDSLGNHRAVVQFNGEVDLAKVLIPWRRRDHNPEDKRFIVQDAATWH